MQTRSQARNNTVNNKNTNTVSVVTTSSRKKNNNNNNKKITKTRQTKNRKEKVEKTRCESPIQQQQPSTPVIEQEPSHNEENTTVTMVTVTDVPFTPELGVFTPDSNVIGSLIIDGSASEESRRCDVSSVPIEEEKQDEKEDEKVVDENDEKVEEQQELEQPTTFDVVVAVDVPTFDETTMKTFTEEVTTSEEGTTSVVDQVMEPEIQSPSCMFVNMISSADEVDIQALDGIPSLNDFTQDPTPLVDDSIQESNHLVDGENKEEEKEIVQEENVVVEQEEIQITTYNDANITQESDEQNVVLTLAVESPVQPQVVDDNEKEDDDKNLYQDDDIEEQECLSHSEDETIEYDNNNDPYQEEFYADYENYNTYENPKEQKLLLRQILEEIRRENQVCQGKLWTYGKQQELEVYTTLFKLCYRFGYTADILADCITVYKYNPCEIQFLTQQTLNQKSVTTKDVSVDVALALLHYCTVEIESKKISDSTTTNNNNADTNSNNKNKHMKYECKFMEMLRVIRFPWKGKKPSKNTLDKFSALVEVYKMTSWFITKRSEEGESDNEVVYKPYIPTKQKVSHLRRFYEMTRNAQVYLSINNQEQQQEAVTNCNMILNHKNMLLNLIQYYFKGVRGNHYNRHSTTEILVQPDELFEDWIGLVECIATYIHTVCTLENKKTNEEVVMMTACQLSFIVPPSVLVSISTRTTFDLIIERLGDVDTRFQFLNTLCMDALNITLEHILCISMNKKELNMELEDLKDLIDFIRVDTLNRDRTAPNVVTENGIFAGEQLSRYAQYYVLLQYLGGNSVKEPFCVDEKCKIRGQLPSIIFCKSHVNTHNQRLLSIMNVLKETHQHQFESRFKLLDESFRTELANVPGYPLPMLHRLLCKENILTVYMYNLHDRFSAYPNIRTITTILSNFYQTLRNYRLIGNEDYGILRYHTDLSTLLEKYLNEFGTLYAYSEIFMFEKVVIDAIIEECDSWMGLDYFYESKLKHLADNDLKKKSLSVLMGNILEYYRNACLYDMSRIMQFSNSIRHITYNHTYITPTTLPSIIDVLHNITNNNNNNNNNNVQSIKTSWISKVYPMISPIPLPDF